MEAVRYILGERKFFDMKMFRSSQFGENLHKRKKKR